MTLFFRFLLFGGALITLFYMLSQIRRSKMLISHTVFWTLFSVGLVILSVVPQIITWTSDLLGIDSPANLVFLVIIFLLIIKLFSSTVKLSQMESRITELTEYIALKENQEQNEVSAKQE